MSSDADAHKVGLIPVTLMVSGNIIGSGVFCYLQTGASTGGIAIYGWLVTIIGALGLSMVYAKMSFLDPSLVVLTRTPAAALARFSVIKPTSSTGWPAGSAISPWWWRRIFKLLLPDSERSIGNHHLRRGAVDLRPAEHCRSENDHPCAAVATVLALIPIVGIAVFGWFWFRGETYGGMERQRRHLRCNSNTLNVTLWSFIGVESASVAAGVVKNPKRNVPIATIGGVLIAAVMYFLPPRLWG
ncbi:Arginine/agmatine antiporter [Escherichia coli]|nr:amino acid permease [Escherichia coli]VCV64756.1 Arginine/agmatine antiporter [Escherichia coli]